MSSSNRPTSRTPSIPIPGAARSIEDILNIHVIGSPSATPARTHDSRQEQRRSSVGSRSLYSGIEASRPSSGVRHASSSSVGTSRHALGGGSGPPWGARTVSASTAPVLPGSFGMYNALQSFEPRVIGGSGGTSAERAGTSSRQEPQTPTSPTRRPPRISTGGRPPQAYRDIPIRSSSIRAPPLVATTSSPYGHHVLGSGAPTAFKKPSYLKYSTLRDLLQTDLDPAPVSPRSVPFPVAGRDITPLTESDEDSESSGGIPRRPHIRKERGRARERQNVYNPPVVNMDPMINLPTRWNEQDRNKFLQVSEDGRNLHFHGPTSQGEKDAAAARANYPVPPACGIYYYEVTIIDKGHKGHISVGFSCGGVRLNRLPGWEKNSWGYHGDDGNSFASEKEGTAFGPRFTTGDVIGCGIDFSLHKAFYTKNSSFIGYIFDNIGQDDTVIYPSVGLRTQLESIRVNFGQEPFKFDIDYHVHCARDRAWDRIQATPVRWTIDETRDVFELEAEKAALKESKAEIKQETTEEDFTPIELPPDYSEPINKLIMSYLQHHGYERTAGALKSQIEGRKKKAGAVERMVMSKKEEMDVDIKMETDDSLPAPRSGGPFDLESLGQESEPSPGVMRSRQRVVGAVLAGDIDLALQLTQELFPAVLDMEDGFLLLKLKCRKFIELMLHASDALQVMKKLEAETGFGSGAGAGESTGSAMDSAMDVDEDGPRSLTKGVPGSDASTPTASTAPPLSPRMKRASSRTAASPYAVAYQTALGEALAYGKALHADMGRSDASTGPATRPEAHALLKTTFSLVTYDDPRVAGGEVQALASHEARMKLAQEVNQAILESQGRPSRPALERLYRQTGATLMQLALWGEGDAAFADLRGEFSDV